MNKEFIKKLLGWRIRFNMSQTDLADELGLTQSTISRWEKGEKIPSLINEERLARWIRNKEDQRRAEAKNR